MKILNSFKLALLLLTYAIKLLKMSASSLLLIELILD
jgi:hypothetical protein